MYTGFQFTFKVRPDGSISTGGVNWGRPLQILRDEGIYKIVRRAGHTAWSGLAQTSYYKPVYMLLEVKNEVATTIEEHEASRSTWRKILKDLNQKLDIILRVLENENSTA